jgi:hypothetical protein
MQNVIEHVIEFNKLLLIWQAPQDEQRIRYVIAELIRKNDEVILRYLNESNDFKKALDLGFDGYPAFSIDKEIHTTGVLDAFMRRLPPRKRGDFQKYLEILCLPQNVDISDFALLGYSAAKLPSDSFSILPSFEGVTGSCEFLMDVAGFRHVSKIGLSQIELGTSVHFEPELNNTIDPNSIRILIGENKIGYVMRGLLPTFHRWLKDWRVTAVVERKNGQPNSPLLYIFVTISPNS